MTVLAFDAEYSGIGAEPDSLWLSEMTNDLLVHAVYDQAFVVPENNSGASRSTGSRVRRC